MKWLILLGLAMLVSVPLWASPMAGGGCCMAIPSEQAACEMVTPIPADEPALCSAQPFSTDTRFMSVTGYLRWQRFVETGQWLTAKEAIAETQQQTMLCARP